MPDSMLVLYFAVALFVIAMLLSEAVVESTASGVVLVSVFVSVGGYLLYWIVLLATGYTHRFVPTVSCIMACGSILTILMVAAFVILRPIAASSSRHWSRGWS